MIQKRFSLDDYLAATSGLSVSASVLVQALDSAAETGQLLAQAARSPVVAGVVGWVDLAAPDVAERVADLSARQDGCWLVGFRHLVQDEPDPRWLERPEVLRGLRAIAAARYVFDVLVRTRELASAIVAVDAVPEGRFVLDHAAKPDIANGITEPWASLVSEMASRENVWCKLSGLVTEAGQPWTREAISPYFDHVLATFGPGRLLFGSDWPVCTSAARYPEVLDLASSLLEDHLSTTEKDMVMAGNAETVYRLAEAA